MAHHPLTQRLTEEIEACLSRVASGDAGIVPGPTLLALLADVDRALDAQAIPSDVAQAKALASMHASNCDYWRQRCEQLEREAKAPMPARLRWEEHEYMAGVATPQGVQGSPSAVIASIDSLGEWTIAPAFVRALREALDEPSPEMLALHAQAQAQGLDRPDSWQHEAKCESAALPAGTDLGLVHPARPDGLDLGQSAAVAVGGTSKG